MLIEEVPASVRDTSRAPRRLVLGLTYATAVLLGAFLLFQVQPLISRFILPWFGGNPAVWTTCLLFFQALLFAGYAYAHLSERLLSPAVQAGVHLALLTAALLVLPIAPDSAWKPPDGSNPAGRILLLLTVTVGLPYFVLSTTAPLIQAWFSRTHTGRSPYRLYALSNLGSLAALLTYPFVVEPALDVVEQATLWSRLFMAFAALAAVCALAAAIIRRRTAATNGSALSSSRQSASSAARPTLGDRMLWLGLPAFASMLLLATTNG